jgi:hypothetical protein
VYCKIVKREKTKWNNHRSPSWKSRLH